jgi:APA family basic amino acid/polyamine antiporter
MSDHAVARPRTGALLAAGCGTAIASVCAVGLFEIERTLGGLWSVSAVVAAGCVCLAVARAFSRLSEVVPSGAGLLAFLIRGLGRGVGFTVAGAYLLLTLFLVGAEAVIVGLLSARLIGWPPLAGSLLFLVGTWACCRAGIRFGYGVQKLATWSLVLGLGALSVASMVGAASRAELATRLLRPAPSPGQWLSGAGQALFLYMGFELITSHVEVAADGKAIARALRGSVAVLAVFYSLVSLGFTCLAHVPVAEAGIVVPQLALAEQSGGRLALLLVVALSLLASFTSFNGSLLALSRFTYALAAQGVLPRRLAKLETRTLVAREALSALLALAIGFTAMVAAARIHQPSIIAAAVAAALAYAGALWARERPPFVERERGELRRLAGRSVAVGLVALGAGVIIAADQARAGTLVVLGSAYGLALVAAARSVHRRGVGRRDPPLALAIERGTDAD